MSFAAFSQEKLLQLLGLCTFLAAAVLTGASLKVEILPAFRIAFESNRAHLCISSVPMPSGNTFSEVTDAACDAQVLRCMLQTYSSQLSGSVHAYCWS